MARTFTLAALLRLRHIEQDSATGALSAANARLRDHQSRRARARIELGGTPTDPANAAALNAVAAARAASRGMLADLESLELHELGVVSTARQQLDAARARAISLEKLAEKHDQLAAAEDLRVEQTIIDELASTSWHRERKATSR